MVALTVALVVTVVIILLFVGAVARAYQKIKFCLKSK